MRIPTILRIVGVLCVSGILVTMFPTRTPIEPVPWDVELAVKYGEGIYAYMDHKFYKVGVVSELTSDALRYAKQQTSGAIGHRYAFVRCAGLKEVRYLSVDDPADARILEKAVFVKPGDAKYDKIVAAYDLQCKEMAAGAVYEVRKWFRDRLPF